MRENFPNSNPDPTDPFALDRLEGEGGLVIDDAAAVYGTTPEPTPPTPGGPRETTSSFPGTPSAQELQRFEDDGGPAAMAA